MLEYWFQKNNMASACTFWFRKWKSEGVKPITLNYTRLSKAIIARSKMKDKPGKTQKSIPVGHVLPTDALPNMLVNATDGGSVECTYPEENIFLQVESCRVYACGVRHFALDQDPAREPRYRALRHHRHRQPLVTWYRIHDDKVYGRFGGAADLKHVDIFVRVILHDDRVPAVECERHWMLVTVLDQL